MSKNIGMEYIAFKKVTGAAFIVIGYKSTILCCEVPKWPVKVNSNFAGQPRPSGWVPGA